MNKFILPYTFPKPSNILLPTIISLEDWSLITVTGPESLCFLQGQLTTDISLLNTSQHVMCAHCNARGKILSTLRLFRYKDGFAYILRHSVKQEQTNELKKYAIFSKVNINYEKFFVLFGITGYKIREILSCFTVLPNKKTPLLQKKENFYILWFGIPIERFLFITTLEEAKFFKKKLIKLEQNNSNQWLTLEMESGFPIIDKKNIKTFVPQSINLNKLKAISFIKGCYSGQEIITKINFKKLNKDEMYLFSGESINLPEIGDQLEAKIHDKWIYIGKILAFARLSDKKIWIQAVIKKKLIKKINLIRICNDVNSKLEIYSAF